MKLNLRAVDLNLLPIFVAVVEEGQLSRAAQRLGMSQPAVSAALQRLRLTVDDDLFTRSRSGLSPTPRATDLYNEVSTHLQNISQALDPSHCFDPATSERCFRLLAPDYFEFLAVGPLVSQLRQSSPAISIQMLPQQDGWQKQLLNGSVDFGLDTQLPADERLQAIPVTEETLAVVARRGHPVITGTLSLENFLAAEHVVLPLRERQVLPLDQILGRPGWRRRVGAHVVQYPSLLSVAAASDLIATVPLRLVRQLAHTLDLQVLPFPVPVPNVVVYLMWPHALARDPAHRWMRQRLEARLTAL